MWVAGQAWLSVDTDRDVLTRLCEAHDERDAMREQIAVDGFMLPGRVTGTGFDGVLLIPSYFEAGRFTAGDIHWANVSGKLTPAGDTEFAQDATFGYASSNLRDFIAEKSDGTITADQVHGITLDDIRLGGPSRVAEILDGVTGGAFVVVNATDYADLEIVVLGLLEVQDHGRSFGYRSGPSFVRAWRAWNRKARSPRRRSGPAATPAATGWSSSVRMSA